MTIHKKATTTSGKKLLDRGFPQHEAASASAHARAQPRPRSPATRLAMDFIRHGGADEEVDDARPPTLTGTKNALDDLADVLSSVKLRGDTPGASGRAHAEVHEDHPAAHRRRWRSFGVRAARHRVARERGVAGASLAAQGASAHAAVRRRGRGGAHLLAGVLAKKAAAVALSPFLRAAFFFVATFSAEKRHERRDESAKPKLVVRYKREAVAAAAGSAASARPPRRTRPPRLRSSLRLRSPPSASRRPETTKEALARSRRRQPRLCWRGRRPSPPRRLRRRRLPRFVRREPKKKTPRKTRRKPRRKTRRRRLKKKSSRIRGAARAPRVSAALDADAQGALEARYQAASLGDRALGSARSRRSASSVARRSPRRMRAEECASSSPLARARPEELAHRLGGDDRRAFQRRGGGRAGGRARGGRALGCDSARARAGARSRGAIPRMVALKKQWGCDVVASMELRARVRRIPRGRPARRRDGGAVQAQRAGVSVRSLSRLARRRTPSSCSCTARRVDAADNLRRLLRRRRRRKRAGDIYWTKHTEKCARVAAGSAAAAALVVASGALHRAFAVVRPPGHHARRARHGLLLLQQHGNRGARGADGVPDRGSKKSCSWTGTCTPTCMRRILRPGGKVHLVVTEHRRQRVFETARRAETDRREGTRV